MKKIILLLLLWLCSVSAWSSPINHIVFFGDSLSDNGNLYRLLFKVIPKSPPYFQGRFSNGPTWAENVGKYYYDKQAVDYKIYAFGGATVILHQPTTRFIAPTILEFEIYQYLLESIFKDKSNTLYSLWMGGNDYLFDQQSDAEMMTQKIVDKISWSMTFLIEQGAKHFLVLNLPDLSRIPFARRNGSVERLHLLCQLHNQKLKTMIEKMKVMYPDIQIISVNINDMFNDVIDHPEKYNEKYNLHITDTTEACWKGGYTLNRASLELSLKQDLKGIKQVDPEIASEYILNTPALAEAYAVGKQYENGVSPCDNASEHIFWDQIHPTEIVHRVLTQIVIEHLSNDMI